MGGVSRLLPVSRCRIVIAVVSWTLISTSGARAQDNPFGGPLSPDAFGGASEPTLTAILTPATAKPGDEVRLSLRLVLPAGSNTYSQDPSFEKPTEIVLSEIVGLDSVEDRFVPDHPPKRAYDRVFEKQVEKFTGEVTWTRRFRLRADVPVDGVYVRGKIDFLVCDDMNCIPHSAAFAVSLTGAPVPAAAPQVAPASAPVYRQQVRPTRRIGGEVRPQPVELEFRLSPQDASAGGTVTLSISMEIDDGWHGYSLRENPGRTALPTRIELKDLHNLVAAGEFTEQPEPTLRGTDLSHSGRVTWTREFRVTSAGTYGLSGSVRYQVCDETSCLPPLTVPFALGAQGTSAGDARAASLQPSAAADGTTGEKPVIMPFTIVGDAAPTTLWMNLLFAFFGGIILNVMPCVLPVIAIKVLSFVQQAGESRGRILALNVAYSGGVVFVFLALATLAVSPKVIDWEGLEWGGLFQYSKFNLIMAALVFAMGLSLLGVFEIPVPGMLGSAAGAQHREGLSGAFLTGIFATLLATPCTGPYMGTALAWSVKQPVAVTYLIWGVLGLGMATPYLVLGAFPALVRWLPRPGMWMVRLKEFAGFVLMGAVVWLISSIDRDLLIPALVILIGVALGLWMIGNLYDHGASPRKKWTVRATALAMSAIVCAFGWRLQNPSEGLPWQDFSTARVEQFRAAVTPILIDFTADWCFNCKTNETVALNRAATRQFMQKHGIIPLKADHTHMPPEITEWLARFNKQGVPLTVIFPKGRPHEAIVLEGVFSQSTLLAKLEQAVAEDGRTTEQMTQVPAQESAATQVLPASENAAALR
jgi:thiol:disulfide interchange protein